MSIHTHGRRPTKLAPLAIASAMLALGSGGAGVRTSPGFRTFPVEPAAAAESGLKAGAPGWRWSATRRARPSWRR